MSVFHAPETAYAKEQWKWDHMVTETHPSDPTIKGMRPASPQEYPMAMYRGKRDDKGILCFELEIAASERERGSYETQGYVAGGKGKALEAFEAQELEFAKLAANRAHQERSMGERARSEAAAVDDSTDQHVPVIPETPIKRRGRQVNTKES